jgi:TBC1 domain family member 8/9
VGQERLSQLTDRLADEVGKRLDIHTIETQPAIGRLDPVTALSEPKARESLLSASQAGPSSPSTAAVSPLSAAAMRQPAYPTPGRAPEPPAKDVDKPLPPKQAADLLALPERSHFTIDEVVSDDDDDVNDSGGRHEVDDSQSTFLFLVRTAVTTRLLTTWRTVMSEVNAFLQANGGDEEGLTGEEKEIAKSKLKLGFAEEVFY